MPVIIHRVNEIEKLRRIPEKYGVEVDVRGFGSKILLSHDVVRDGLKYEELEEYLKNFKHAFIIFNVKEAGYEKDIILLAKKYNINNYFILDAEFPFIYSSTRRENFNKIAIRYSEAEPIEMAEAQIVKGKTLVEWIWIDTNTLLPLNYSVIEKIRPFKSCLVCPERWGRPQEIPEYIKKIKELNFKLDAVMTSQNNAQIWEESGVIKLEKP